MHASETLRGNAPELSLVLPVFDEEAVLVPNLRAMVRALEELGGSFEIVAVDDGSRDRSGELLLELAREEPRLVVERLAENRGKGAAVRRGVLRARGERILFMDADLSVPLEELPRLVAALERAPVAIGSRRVPGARITRRQPWLRETLGRCFTGLARALLAPGIHDFTCGFKGFRRDAARAIFERVTQEGWAFDAELVVIARAQGLAIEQVPVGWRHEEGSKVRVGRAVLRSLRELWAIRANLRGGRYR